MLPPIIDDHEGAHFDSFRACRSAYTKRVAATQAAVVINPWRLGMMNPDCCILFSRVVELRLGRCDRTQHSYQNLLHDPGAD